jgi:hypothetical protein
MAQADNDYADCLLGNLPDVQNDPAAYSVMRLCIQKYQSGISGIEKRDGWFARYSSGAACVLSKGKAAGGRVGPLQIQAMCYALYEPTPFAKALQESGVTPPARGMFDDLIPKK